MKVIVSFISVFSIFFGFNTSKANVTPPLSQGLLHHWNFDCGRDWHDSPFQTSCELDTAWDSVGTAHAKLKNMSAKSWVSGRQYTALYFDDPGSYLEVDANLGAALGRNATLSFWIKTTQKGSAQAASAPCVAGALGRNSVQWGWLDDQGYLNLGVAGTATVRTSKPINDGQWHHLVFTRNASNGECTVFLDGQIDGKNQGAKGARATAFKKIACLDARGQRPHLHGTLDQIHLFNRLVNADEVTTLFHNHAPKCWDLVVHGSAGNSFSTGSVLHRAFDVERTPLQVVSWTQPRHGRVTPHATSAGSFEYHPRPNTKHDTFTATITDGQGGYQRMNIIVHVDNEVPRGGVPVMTFSHTQAVTSDKAALSYEGMRIPRLVHWSSPKKLDLLVGHKGTLWLHQNRGTPEKPDFAPGIKVTDNQGTPLPAGHSDATFAMADMDGDGSDDLIQLNPERKLYVYRNLAKKGQPASLAAPGFTLKKSDGSDLIIPDSRFDIGDWDGDGRPDLITGTRSGSVQLWLNIGTKQEPRFEHSRDLNRGSYNLYPRLYDLNQNGIMDYLCTVNWGSITYWRDAGKTWPCPTKALSLTSHDAEPISVRQLTDGPIVDFGDLNGDGIPDIVVGGQIKDQIHLALGTYTSVAESIAQIEAIYNAHPKALGSALDANKQLLLGKVNTANRNLIDHISMGTLQARNEVYNALTGHIRKYPFLQYQTHTTNDMLHVASIVVQNWVMLQNALPDDATRRQAIADTLGLTGVARTIYLESGLALGDNAASIPAAYQTVCDLMRRQPRELFPDAFLTIDQLYGQNRGGLIWTPSSGKNTFGQWAVHAANEWSADLTAAIEKILGKGAAHGDYFTFVMAHEVTHSLDNYVRTRANKDLNRRWGQLIAHAGGPDVMSDANGWFSLDKTKQHFKNKGYWDGDNDTWKDAWEQYWKEGAGKSFKHRSFMRGSIDWFLNTSQETLATQANHHWANGVGRLIGATARFKQGITENIPPLKANINEVVTFIDFISVGMNRVNLVETKSHKEPQRVEWIDHYADLERNQLGYITGIKVDDLSFAFEYDDQGIVTNVITDIMEKL